MTPIELFGHESKDKYQHYRIQRSLPGVLRRRRLTHAPITYKRNIFSSQMKNIFLQNFSEGAAKTKKNMIAYQETLVLVGNAEADRNIDSIFLTCAQLAAYITAHTNTTDGKLLIIDCGSPLRHTERRIQNSILLNVNDKISRKRLSTRGLKNFLDVNQLNRLEKSECIVLYDDSIRPASCSNLLVLSQLSPPTKCIYDEIKRYDNNKPIYILQSRYDEFYQQYPSFCHVSQSTDEDLSFSSLPTVDSISIESYQLSQVLPGLYLGNARDAEDLNLLQQHDISFIINISTSIPCYFENEKGFEYMRLPCHDSSNQNIIQYFETAFAYIDRILSMKKNILVHCQGGVSRSPSFIIGYLMRYQSKTFDEAHRLVKTKRSIINPNLHFLGQLSQYEQSLASA